MGAADAITTQLFAARRRSDLEMQLSMILERKLAVQDECNEVSAILANTIFQNDNHGTISQAAITPGFYLDTPVVPALSTLADVPYGAGDYEQKLAELQRVEKQLDTQQKKMETELEAVKAEEESFKKIAQDHAKNDFKVGG